MSTSYVPAPREVLSIVEEELAGIGGRIGVNERQRGRIFLRATVPHTRLVRPNDHLQGGIAVATTGREIFVFPYVFRQLSGSGAIMVSTPGFKALKRKKPDSTVQTVDRLRSKLRSQVLESTSAETLVAVTDQLRSAAQTPVDISLQMSAVISRIPRKHSSLLLSQILSEFHEDEDNSVYGLMNAVAAVARTEEDPEIKWDLEKLAGEVPALVPLEDVAPTAQFAAAY